MTDHNAQSSDPSSRANSFPWPPVLLASVIVAAWGLGRLLPLAWPGLDDTASHVIGLGFGLTGAGLVLWSVVTLARAKTTVMPNGVSSALVTSGPYTRFRNPIYLGEVLIVLGLAEWTKNIWFVLAAAAFGVLVTWLQILAEERHLSAQFGAGYADYFARSKRWI
jgi:protein-S-isoprenylcysteine O-methyltransferase Ste14